MPRNSNWLIGALALAGLSAVSPTSASPRLPEAIAIELHTFELQVRSVRTLATPPAISNRTNNMMRQGIPLPQIVAGLQSMEPYRNMRYIGIERFDPRTGIYTLRFLNGRQIVVVQVDGRSGRIINRGF